MNPEPFSLLVFAVDSLRVGVSAAAVVRVVRAVEVTPLPGAPALVSGAINLAGDVLPVFDLRQRLGLPRRPIRADDLFLIVRSLLRTAVLPIDDAHGLIGYGPADVVAADHLAPGMEHLPGLLRLPDGLLLIHDPDRFLNPEQGGELDRALQAGTPHED